MNTFWSENAKVRDHLHDLDVDGMLMLKWQGVREGCLFKLAQGRVK